MWGLKVNKFYLISFDGQYTGSENTLFSLLKLDSKSKQGVRAMLLDPTSLAERKIQWEAGFALVERRQEWGDYHKRPDPQEGCWPFSHSSAHDPKTNSFSLRLKRWRPQSSAMDLQDHENCIWSHPSTKKNIWPFCPRISFFSSLLLYASNVGLIFFKYTVLKNV